VGEYLSCCIVETKNERKLTMIQPHLLTHLNQKFRAEIKDIRKYLSPGDSVGFIGIVFTRCDLLLNLENSSRLKSTYNDRNHTSNPSCFSVALKSQLAFSNARYFCFRK
jgi:hypothetical protein